MEQKAPEKKDNIRNNGLQTLVVREFMSVDEADVQRIFYEGMMEMVPDTAFRGLRHHPESLFLYTAMTALCFAITMCWWVIGLLPAIVLCGRYLYSRRVIHGYLEQAMSRDMGSCLWVAVLEGRLVGVVAAVGQLNSGAALELQRMSVDQSYRQCGVGVALDAKMSVEYHASTVTNMDIEDSKIGYKQLLMDAKPWCSDQNVEQDQQNNFKGLTKEKDKLQENLGTMQRLKQNLEARRDQLEKNNEYLTRKRDQIQTNNNLLTEETNKLKLSQSELQAANAALTNELEELKAAKQRLDTNNDALVRAKDSLQKQYDSVVKRRQELQSNYDAAIRERNNLQNKFNNVTRSKEQLQVKYNDMIRNVEHLQDKYNFSNSEKDRLATSHQNLTIQKDTLQENFNVLKKAADDLQASYTSLSQDKKELENTCKNVTVERDLLRVRVDNLTVERDLLRGQTDELNATLTRKTCPTGWQIFQYKCYFTSVSKKTWRLGREYCRTRGADLAIIKTQSEMAFINGLYGTEKEVWIGLTDEKAESQWTWVDGTPLTTAYWAKGQPNSHEGKNQDCVEFWHRASGIGDWNDESCNIEQFFICQM
ncbi:hypothetical protein INR49_022997 [Caranx melampygus]|nr:hypothetical protein INR49_022997 [Caranx melampygus]